MRGIEQRNESPRSPFPTSSQQPPCISSMYGSPDMNLGFSPQQHRQRHSRSTHVPLGQTLTDITFCPTQQRLHQTTACLPRDPCRTAAVAAVTRLLATIEGRPLPTELPQRPPPSSSGGGGGKYGGGFGNGSSGGGSTDQRGMERLAGETDSEYVARQTSLRGEASARMRDKFGGSNRMQGLGSDSSYDPTSGGYGGGGRGGGGMTADDIGGQIGVMGQKSIRFLSESFATLQTGVKVIHPTLYM